MSNSATFSGLLHWRVDEDQDGDFAQSISELRQWVEVEGDARSHVALVTSAHPAEGRSTVAMQLVHSAESTGKRAVLVDADQRFRRIATDLIADAKTDLAENLELGPDLKLLDALRDDFDLIVIDAPPMATPADAEAMVGSVDRALVVVKAGQTEQKDVLEIIDRIDVRKGKAVGVVLNMVKLMARG